MKLGLERGIRARTLVSIAQLVERAPGVKDEAKVRALIAAARGVTT